MNKLIPLAFIRDRKQLSWKGAAWGYHHGYLSWSDVLELAVNRLVEGEENAVVIELAGLSKSNIQEIEICLDKLASILDDESECFIKNIWIYLGLSWLYENRTVCADPLGDVEEIYSDFDYPEEIAPFVRYVPVEDDYDPVIHTSEENYTRLMRKWKNYLISKGESDN